MRYPQPRRTGQRRDRDHGRILSHYLISVQNRHIDDGKRQAGQIKHQRPLQPNQIRRPHLPGMEIKTLASLSVGIHLAQDAFAFQIRQMLEQLDFVEAQIAALDQEILAYMDQLDSPVTSVPGVGPVYGAVILSEIGDIHRFPSGKQLVSYAGIDATVHESGEFQATQAHMSKRGSPYL